MDDFFTWRSTVSDAMMYRIACYLVFEVICIAILMSLRFTNGIMDYSWREQKMIQKLYWFRIKFAFFITLELC